MWSLTLVASFNTPSQLGRTPFANLFANLYYLYHQCTALVWSALLNYEEVGVMENVSYHFLLTRSQCVSKESVSYHSY